MQTHATSISMRPVPHNTWRHLPFDVCLIEVRDTWTGYLVPGRDGPGALPNGQSSWDAAVVFAAAVSHLEIQVDILAGGLLSRVFIGMWSPDGRDLDFETMALLRKYFGSILKEWPFPKHKVFLMDIYISKITRNLNGPCGPLKPFLKSGFLAYCRNR